jgi:glycosyltransferase involved in cell wall biosynthesis
VEVCVYHEGEDREYPGVTIHRIKPPSWLGSIGPGFSIKKLFADVYLLALAVKTFRRFKPDVVHAGEEAVFMAMLLKSFSGTPYVYDMDSSIASQLVEKKPWLAPVSGIFRFFEGLAIRGAVACAPVCHALADLAKAEGARRLVTLHDISDLKDPGRKPTGFLRQEVGIPDGRPILMYVGNLESYQGIDLLLEGFSVALKEGAGVELVIAGGSDADIAKYKAMVDELDLSGRVHLLGRWPAADLDRLLAEADILTAPRTKGLNTPQKIFPYMHSGKAVLLTDLPTHSQIVDSEVCFLADPSPEGFGAAIAQLAKDSELREKLGLSGRAFVEANHTFSAHQSRVDELYDTVGDELPCARHHSQPA